MKNLTFNFCLAFLTFMSPLFPLMMIITIATIFDTFVGRWYAKQKGELITSGKTRRGLCVKLIIYLSVILFSYFIDYYIINEITRKYIWFDYGFTKLWTGFFIWIEYTSIDEKVKWVKGEGITDKIKKFFSGLKSIIYGASEVKDRLEK